MAYSPPRLERVKDNVIRVYHPELLEPTTNLTASVAAGGVTLTVADNAGYSNTDPQDLLFLEGYGIETAEITRLNGAITAGTSLTVQTLIFAHGIDTSVSKILFNRIEIRGGTTAAIAASASGTIVQFAGSNDTPINVTGEHTDFVVTGTTFAFYSARFYNSLATTAYYSAFSGGVAATDFTPRMVGFITRNAFKNIGEVFGPPKWTPDWVYDQIYLGELDVAKELKRWSWLYTYDSDLGNLTTGQRRIALPSDIEDDRTLKSLLGMRIEDDINLDLMDWTEYQTVMQNVSYTTVGTAGAVADTTLTLTDSRDFDTTGSILVQVVLTGVVFSNSSADVVLGTFTTHGLATGDRINVTGCTQTYANTDWTITLVSANTFTLDNASWALFTGADVTGNVVPAESRSFAYTGNNRTTALLTGITALTVGISAASEVWQGLTFGTPERVAVNDGFAYFDIPPSEDFNGRNAWADYYATVSRKDTDEDEVSVNDPQLLISWLEMAIKKEKANGSLSLQDISVVEYNRRKQKLIQNEITGTKLKMIPSVPVGRTGRRNSWWR
mgnify:CR=1 FL=1